jgi:hypothetical protein
MPNRAPRTKYIQLGVYDPNPDSDDLHLLGRPMKDTSRNRRYATEAISEFIEKAETRREVTWCMGLFPVTVRARVRKTK